MHIFYIYMAFCKISWVFLGIPRNHAASASAHVDHLFGYIITWLFLTPCLVVCARWREHFNIIIKTVIWYFGKELIDKDILFKQS